MSSSSQTLSAQHVLTVRRLTRELDTLLESLPTSSLPPVLTWGLHADAGEPPTIRITLESLYGSLSETRADLAAWADAIGGTVTEELRGSTLNLTATALRETGTRVEVHNWRSASSRCPQCGGPAIRDEVIRHYSDIACGGVR